MVSPADFIAVAEDTGLIVPIGTWMLRAACSQLVTWLVRFPDRADLSINVNMSVRHLRQADIVEQVLQTLAETGLPANHLKLEVTESMLMENADTQVDVLRQLRKIGVGVAIDDFGTGYSSLSYLQRFPIDALKIDRSFIAHETRSDNWEIVRMIIALARDKRALTVAEGVETEDQARDLRNLGCDRAQGYLYGRPLEAEAAEKMLLSP
jgi:EAL domain-containing protein (putative c-di-GMP-specific phosphodiesterase class I)